ncbi:MAG TPA: hypothetical protein V6D26_04435 [Stenomitos sp.]
MNSKDEIASLRQTMIAHGILVMFMSLVAGLGLWMSLVGGFELIPGQIIEFGVPGTPEGWARAHRGTPMNGMMVLAFAAVLPLLNLDKAKMKLFGWIVILTAWSNTAFYFFSNFSQNRGLTFGSNSFGPGDINSFLALAPAYLFGVISMFAFIWVAFRLLGLSKGDSKNKSSEAN